MLGIYLKLTESNFIDLFLNNELRKNSFSMENLSFLYYLFVEESEMSDSPYLFDFQDICGNYGEMTVEDFVSYYKNEISDDVEDIDDIEELKNIIRKQDFVLNIDSKGNVLHRAI